METKVKRKIEFTGKNLNDVFELACLTNILKLSNKPVLILDPRMTRHSHLAVVGNTIVEYYDGTFEIEKNNEQNV